jgi:hypothetical protein
MKPAEDDADLGLFVTDTEMFRRLNVPEKIGRAAVRELEKDAPGRPKFPQKDPLIGRRFWPSVVNYFRMRHGLTASPQAAPQWQERRRYATPKAGETGTSGDPRPRLETPRETLDRVLAGTAGSRKARLPDQEPPPMAAVKSAHGGAHRG